MGWIQSSLKVHYCQTASVSWSSEDPEVEVRWMDGWMVPLKMDGWWKFPHFFGTQTIQMYVDSCNFEGISRSALFGLVIQCPLFDRWSSYSCLQDESEKVFSVFPRCLLSWTKILGGMGRLFHPRKFTFWTPNKWRFGFSTIFLFDLGDFFWGSTFPAARCWRWSVT